MNVVNIQRRLAQPRPRNSLLRTKLAASSQSRNWLLNAGMKVMNVRTPTTHGLNNVIHLGAGATMATGAVRTGLDGRGFDMGRYAPPTGPSGFAQAMFSPGHSPDRSSAPHSAVQWLHRGGCFGSASQRGSTVNEYWRG